MNARTPVLDSLAEHILYLAALVADHPRAIDRHLDYFGGGLRPPPDQGRPTTRPPASR